MREEFCDDLEGKRVKEDIYICNERMNEERL